MIPNNDSSKEYYLHYLKHLFPYEHFKELLQNKDVLEIGCGEGYGTNVLSGNVKSIIGIDVDAKIIEHAKGKYVASNCHFSTYDGRRLPFPDASFDSVVSFQVIEHVQDDAQFVREIYRILRPAGIAVITTPNRKYRLKPGQKPWNRFHIREYLGAELKKLFQGTFDNVDLKGIRAIDEIQNHEHKMAKGGFQRYDYFNLRHLVPESLKPVIRKTLRSAMAMGTRPNKDELVDYRKVFSLKDFYLIDDRIDDEALDLVTISQKA